MKHRGFTLIELMVVVSIISLLASMVLAAVSAARDKADNAYRIRTIEEYQKAILLARDDLGGFPAPSGNETSGAWVCLDDSQPCPLTYHPFGAAVSYQYPPSPTLMGTLQNYIKIKKQFPPDIINTVNGPDSYPGPIYMCMGNGGLPTSPPYLCPAGSHADVMYDLRGDNVDCGPGKPSSMTTQGIVSGHTTCIIHIGGLELYDSTGRFISN